MVKLSEYEQQFLENQELFYWKEKSGRVEEQLREALVLLRAYSHLADNYGPGFTIGQYNDDREYLREQLNDYDRRRHGDG